MFELMQQGGVVAWIILGSGIMACLVFAERVLHLHRARIKSEDFIAGICNNLRRGNVDEALAICDETPGPVAGIVRVAILNRNNDKEAIRSAIENTGRTEIARMERRLAILATVAQVAPIFGLLGTVLGMIKGLQIMKAQAPLVQSADVITGLLQALVTTAAGLAVAAPCYVAFNYLLGKVEKIVIDMERSASDILAFLTGGQIPVPTTRDEGKE
ncbi:MAG: MotA/TolQ/ExbB proton channel family protein [bacterium]